jgi:lipoprotein-anchoring transpeptidase ErfK/SrfK
VNASRATNWILQATLALTTTLVSVPALAGDGAAVASVSRRIVVSIPDRRLAVLENDEVVSLYTVAVGAPDSPSPVGTFTVVNRVSNPTYYKPGTVIAPGATNPIGTRWIGLSEKGYGIHGTDQPRSIGFAKSHGCIRLRNQDVEKLFERVRPGDVVELHGERTPELERIFAAK